MKQWEGPREGEGRERRRLLSRGGAGWHEWNVPNASKAALEAHNSQLICLLYPVKKHAHVHTRARMPQRDGKRARLLLLLLLNFCYLHVVAAYKGGYFRFGTLSWKQTKIEADGITVQFTLKTAWNRAYFSRGASDTPYGNCVECYTVAQDPQTQCDNFPAGKQTQSDCILPIAGDKVALFDAVDTSNIDQPTLGGALPPVETSFTFGDDPAKMLTGARVRTGRLYVPKCRSEVDNSAYLGKCIEGTVVDSFGVETSMPSPEADARNIVYVVSEIFYKYPLKTATYLVGFQGCCRMGAPPDGDGEFYDLSNNANGAFFLRNAVSLTVDPLVMQTGTAAGPFFAHTPHITVIKGRPLKFRVHAFDAASRPIKYKIGNDDDHGVGLNQAASPPFGNAYLATIEEDTGIVTFPASASTSYENYYSLVVVAESFGPCTNWDSTAGEKSCLKTGGIPNSDKSSAIVDFLIRVVQAGFTGDWPQSRCDNSNSGLPPGSQVCNTAPVMSVPSTTQRFICNEDNSFQVTATDGPGNDKTVSLPAGAFAIRWRQRLPLDADYPRGECSDQSGFIYSCVNTQDCMVQTKGLCTKIPNSPKFAFGDEAYGIGNRALDRGMNTSTARATFAWKPLCERLGDDRMYTYQGNHRLDVFGLCFVAVDEGGGFDSVAGKSRSIEKLGKLTSTPSCVEVAVLRCTKPTIQLISMSKPAANATLSIWRVPVSTNISLLLNGTDDTQSRHITIYHTSEQGIPSEGVSWGPQQCNAVQGLSITCNPVKREFFFDARLVHAGFTLKICFEAVNDQVECPRYREHESPVAAYRPITVSQASEPLCVNLEVPGPILVWMEPTPQEDETVLTYMGCPRTLTLVAEDLSNFFDLEIVPWTDEYALPDGIIVGDPQCSFQEGVPKPAIVAQGVGTCPKVSRTLDWMPARVQSGLKSRVCIDIKTQTVIKATRCFVFHVSKCRYCAQTGETLQSLAESFYTDWLQIWAANTHLTNPNDFKLYQLINIGAMYPAREGDTLGDLAHRFRSDIRSLMLANPEVRSKDEVLPEGRDICILAGICNSAEYSASAST